VSPIAPRSRGYMALLVALSSFGPLTMSIYTPVMPSVGTDLGAVAGDVKLTLTTYMLGFAVGQLFYGPLSDRYGRRPVLLGGLVFFMVASAACALAGSIGDLIVLRVIQGLAAASGGVLGRALARDVYDFKEMALVMSWVGLGINFSPAIAPSLGGLMAEWFGWRSSFWVVAGFGAILCAVVALGYGETNRHRSEALNLAGLLRGSGEMLGDRRFLGFVLTLGFAFALNFGMLAGTPFILQEQLGFSPREFGLIVLLSVGGFTLGGVANNRLIGRVAPTSILRWGVWCHVAALVAMAAVAQLGPLAWWMVIAPHMLISFGSGMLVPNTLAGAVGLYPKLAGTASSWAGLSQMGVGALGTVAVVLVEATGAVASPATALAVALAPFAAIGLYTSGLARPRPGGDL